MAGDKIHFVKESLKEVIEFLADGDRISIITFNEKPEIIIDLTRVQDQRKKIVEKIDLLFASGGTNIYEGMNSALTLLAKRNSQADVTSVFLLTDGLDNY